MNDENLVKMHEDLMESLKSKPSDDLEFKDDDSDEGNSFASSAYNWITLTYAIVPDSNSIIHSYLKATAFNVMNMWITTV